MWRCLFFDVYWLVYDVQTRVGHYNFEVLDGVELKCFDGVESYES